LGREAGAMKRSGKAILALVVLWLIGADLLIALAGRFGLVNLPGGAILLLVLPLLVLSSLFWLLWVSDRLHRCPGWVRLLLTLYIMVMLAPFAAVLAGGRELWDRQPVPVIMWIMVWHLVAFLLACAAIGIGIVRLPLALCRKRMPGRRPHIDPAAAAPAEASDDPRMDRRAVLGWATAIGSLAVVGTGVGVGHLQTGRCQIRRVKMSLPRCPDRLKGLTITHLSDLHVGRLLRPEHLPALVDAANELDSDLVVVTGDIVDHSIDFLPAAADAIARLRHRYGRFLVMGNHDLIDSGSKFVSEMTRRERGFLCDEHAVIRIGGEPIQIAGLRWSHADYSDGKHAGHQERAEVALLGTDPSIFTIALAHHPHAFDPLAARGADLTLAGHTPGGQFNLALPGSGRSLSAGSLLFRYVHGEYRKGPAAMYVNAGAGNWFPVRINAPAEIVQIQLT
jgi:predicted MPP superfamily phosphohydrolase